MKRTLILFTFLLIATMSLAQTQQGYVKTLGRPDKAGEPLGGVSVRVKGGHNEVLSGSDGIFEMRMDGKKNGEAYALQSVQKAGYELNENDIIGRQFAFSDKVRLEIVMVSSSVLQAEKRRIEDNAYRTAERNYKAKAEALEQQLRDSAISIQQYRERMAELQDKFEKYQSLIDGLAEHYAHTDYDKLNETDREINICIENGELERADSLINTLFDPIGVLERNMEALARIEQQMSQAQGIISQANADMAAVLKQQEKDAEYLYQLYTIALARYDNEKAQQYIVTRALLDTTNAQWQTDAGYYLVTHNNFEQAELLYVRAVAIYRNMDKDGLAGYGLDMAYTLSNLGNIFIITNRSEKSVALFEEAMQVSDKLLEMGIQQAYGTKALALTGIGKYCVNSQHFSEAWEIFAQGIELFTTVQQSPSLMNNPSMAKVLMMMIQEIYDLGIRSYSTDTSVILQAVTASFDYAAMEDLIQLIEEDILVFGPITLQIMQLMSDLYLRTQDYPKCETLMTKAVEISRRLVEADPEANMTTLIQSLQDLANFYSQTNRLAESETLYDEALSLVTPLAESNPMVYNSNLIYVQSNLGDLCTTVGITNLDIEKLRKAERLLTEALSLARTMSQYDPQRYETSIYGALFMLGDLYNAIGQMTQDNSYFEQSVRMYEEAIVMGRSFAAKSAEIYEVYLADVLLSAGKAYHNLGYLYQDPTYYGKSEGVLEEFIAIGRRLVQDNPQFEKSLADGLIFFGTLYRDWDKLDQCEPYYNEGLALWRRLATENPAQHETGLIETLGNMALYKSLCGLKQDAIKLAEEAVEINKKHNKDIVSYCYLLDLLGNLYAECCNYTKAYDIFNELHSLLKALFPQGMMQDEYVLTLGNKSFCAIFLKQFAEAEQCAREALEIDITQKWIFTNLAAALLFQGKYAEAEEIYAFLKPELRDSLLEDLVAYEEAGIIPRNRKADVERIRRMLNE